MNPYDHRPITFNEVELPAEMMGISILENLVPMPENIGEWLWRFPICKGFEKHSDSFTTRNTATIARDAMLEHRSKVLAGIAERFPVYNAENIYTVWMDGLTKIIDISNKTSVCRWVAPLSSSDPIQTLEDTRNFLRNLKKD